MYLQKISSVVELVTDLLFEAMKSRKKVFQLFFGLGLSEKRRDRLRQTIPLPTAAQWTKTRVAKTWNQIRHFKSKKVRKKERKKGRKKERK